MKTRRIKVRGETAVYHCITRVVDGAKWFKDKEKEVLRKQMWQVAEFCGVEVLTYCMMSNHFHILVRVPEVKHLSDEEFVRRFALLYHREPLRIKAFEDHLKENAEVAVLLRKRMLARMGDVSAFMKELKQRFSVWYNRSNDRYGTLWAERFKSVLVENKTNSMRVVAAYIDLNPVRAGLVDDPKDYRFCGYAEAIGGVRIAQSGIKSINMSKCIDHAFEEYRLMLFGMGSVGKNESGSMNGKSLRKVIEAGGELPVFAVLRCRVRYMTDGAILGSQNFVSEYFNAHRKNFGKRRKKAFNKMKGSDWGGLVVFRGLRSEIFK